MPLTPDEEKRLNELLQKLKVGGLDALTSGEAKELERLLHKKYGDNPDLDLVLALAFGLLLGYLLAKGK